MNVQIIPADNSQPTSDDDRVNKLPFENIKTIVGGHIEVIKLTRQLVMIVNEEGAIRQLPLNQRASNLLQSYYALPTVPIYGDVVWGPKKLFEL